MFRNIVRLLDAYDTDRFVYIVLELYVGAVDACVDFTAMCV